jgi:hypothetical protein
MTSMPRQLATVAALTLVALSVTSARAGAPDHSPRLLALLHAYDQLPTAEALRSAAGALPVEEALFQVAADAELPVYPRQRATTLMSAFINEVTRAHLLTLAATAELQDVRWSAIYTFVRAVAPSDRAAALTFAGTLLKSPHALDREAVIRSLRHVVGAEVDALVAAHQAKDPDATVQAAIRRFWQTRR